MKNVRPIYGKDFKPGTIIFTAPVKPGFVSKGIIWFQTLEEQCAFVASHVSMVVNEHLGIESAEHGVEFFPLSRYFEGDEYEVVCREPFGMTEFDAKQALAAFADMETCETNYDYTGLFGYIGKILLPFNRLLPFLNKLPAPLHTPGSYFCSAAAAIALKATDKYKGCDIFRKYHVSRIGPVILWNHFPWKPYSFNRNREGIA